MTAPTRSMQELCPTYHKVGLATVLSTQGSSQAAPERLQSARRAWSERSEVWIGANCHEVGELLDSSDPCG